MKKKVLFHSLFIVIITAGSLYIFLNKSIKTSAKSIKGMQTHVLSSTPTPTFSPTLTPIPTPTDKPWPTEIQPTPTKQYGGWYWQSDHNRAQFG